MLTAGARLRRAAVSRVGDAELFRIQDCRKVAPVHRAARLGATAAGHGFRVHLENIQALALMTARFPQVPKVFEVPTPEAMENLDFVLEHGGAALGSAAAGIR